MTSRINKAHKIIHGEPSDDEKKELQEKTTTVETVKKELEQEQKTKQKEPEIQREPFAYDFVSYLRENRDIFGPRTLFPELEPAQRVYVGETPVSKFFTKHLPNAVYKDKKFIFATDKKRYTIKVFTNPSINGCIEEIIIEEKTSFGYKLISRQDWRYLQEINILSDIEHVVRREYIRRLQQQLAEEREEREKKIALDRERFLDMMSDENAKNR